MTLTVQRDAFDQPVISPELALVDPELAAAARLLVPDPREEVRTARPRPQASSQRETTEASVRRARSRSRLAAVAAAGFTALAAAVAGITLATDRATAEATPAAAAARALQAARTYRWTAVTGAAAYEFELLRGTDAVYRATTRDLAVELPARLRLAPGRYTWLVTPTYEGQSVVSPRRPVVEATFQVAPS